MHLIKIFIFGLIACICMYSVTYIIWKKNIIPEYLTKFKWIIFILIFFILLLVEDYSGFLKLEDNKKIIIIINLFIAYAFISGIKNIKK